jgi:hypothetical protein
MSAANSELRATSADYLENNRHVYALKARRKRIAMITVTATNIASFPIRLLFEPTRLHASGREICPERAEHIIRKLSEFTWDFFLYLVIDFHPILALVDIAFLLAGPIYNRRLRKQLNAVAADDLLLQPNEERTFLLAFAGVPKSPRLDHLELHYSAHNGRVESTSFVECPISKVNEPR